MRLSALPLGLLLALLAWEAKKERAKRDAWMQPKEDDDD